MPSDAVPFPSPCMQPAETAIVQITVKTTVPVDPTTWVDEHGDYLFRYAVVRLRDEAVAEDCVQEAFLSAIKALDSYGGKSTERTWLTGILKHKIIDHFRKSVREEPITEEDTDPTTFDVFFQPDGRWKDHWSRDFKPIEWRITPEAIFQETEFFRVLQGCLSKLPERVAGVFALREMDGLETAEICEILSLSASNFWVMMHRARLGLRRCVELKWFKRA